MLEAEVRPMTDDDDFSFPSTHLGRSFRRSLSAHPTQCHDKDRVSFVAAVHMQDMENPVLQSMSKLLTSLLRLPAAGAGMMSRGKLEYTGFVQPNDWPAPSLAALPAAQELLVVSDLQRDPRFSGIDKMGPARFYISAPLTTSTGMQIGALHAMDLKPRSGGLSGEEKRIFMDMVRIMSHKIEEDYRKRVEQEQIERNKDQLLQALDKIRSPICVCEIVQANTKILFANHTWTTLAGVGDEPLVNISIWDILKAADESQEEAQARFWACDVGKQDFAANFELRVDHKELSMRLHFRSANRGAPKAMKENKGLLSQAVTKALEPSFFFAMFEQDVDDFITGKTPNGAASATSGRVSAQMSRAGSSFLDNDLLEATAQAAGMAVRERPSGTVSPSLQEAAKDPSPSKDPSGPPSARTGPSAPGLTIEDSAELPATTKLTPAGRKAPRQATVGEGKESPQPTKPTKPTPQKVKQPRCGCTIC